MQILEVGSQIETCLMPDDEMNGLKGHIVCYNAASLRYTLELENGDMMSLQAKNIKSANATDGKDKTMNATSGKDDVKDDNNAPSNVLNLVNGINEKLHKKPFDIIVEGLYWCFILCFVCLPGSIIQFLYTGYRVYKHCSGDDEEKHVIGYVIDDDAKTTTPTTDNNTTTTTVQKPSQKKKQLGVVITGCDSGFGKELAIQLLESSKQQQDFVVFCGCLLEESMEYFKQYGSAIPIQMDVTNDEQVQAAATYVSNWLMATHIDAEEERHLLALVNNAGIGIPGLVDWLEVSDFQKVFDVNYFGTIRCVKAFQPIFKGQATALEQKNAENSSSYKYYPDGRIINVISVAGIFAPGQYGNAYGSSKHALEAFTNNLRQEMSMFGIKVVGIHPGFHSTPMLQKHLVQSQATIDKLSLAKRQEYGDTFIQAFLNLKAPPGFDSRVVTNVISDVIVSKNPPIKNLVGLDAKYLFHFFSKLPTWLGYGIFNKLMESAFQSEEEYVPKIMLDKKKDLEQQKKKEEEEESSSSSSQEKKNK